MSVAVEKYNWLAAQEGIPNKMEEAEMEVTFRGHVRSLLEDMECSAMTWMQGSDGQWRVIENMVGRLWALEDATKRLVAAVKKSAMMQLILKTMGVGIKSEMETAMRRWRTQTQIEICEMWVQKGKRARMRRLVQRYFLAAYTYWVREERQRRDRPVWICGPDEKGSRAEEPILRELKAMEEALYKWKRHNDEENYLGRFGRAARMMRAAAYWRRRELGRRLIQFIVNVGWDPESNGEEWEMSGGAELMGLETSKDEERAVEYMQQKGLTEEIQDGKQGNCCFRSLAAEASWGSEKHQEMGEATVAVMRREKMATDEECDEMSKAGTWGDTRVIEAASRMLSRQITVIVMEPRTGEPVIQKIGRTTDGMEDREMTIIYRREHFNSSGGDRHRKEELGGRIFWMRKMGEHWRVDGWTQAPVEAEGVMTTAGRKATEITGGVKHHVQNVWQHVGGGDRQRREPDEKEW